MYLQLAENGQYVPPSVYMADPGRLTRVSGYRRKGNRVKSHLRRLSEGATQDNPYVYLPEHISPTGDALMVREDYFDYLSPEEWKGLMWQLAPFQAPVQNGQMSEGMFLSDRASRKIKREERKKNKAEKKTAKVDKKKAKNELKLARAQAKREGKGADILGSITDTLGGIFGKKPDGGGESAGGGGGETDKPGFFDGNTFGISNKVVVPAAVGTAAILFFGFKKRSRR